MNSIRTFALFVLLAAGAGLSAQAPEQWLSETRQVSLTTDAGWLDTGIDVTQGDPLNIVVRAASPEQRFRSARLPAQGPAGEPGTEGRGAQDPSAPVGAVIARIGDGSFLVGASWPGPAPATGRLMLAINVPPGRRIQTLYQAEITHGSRPPEPPPQAPAVNEVAPPPPPIVREAPVPVPLPAPPPVPAPEPGPDWTMIGLGAGAVALALGTLLALKLAATPAAPAAPPAVTIDPSLDPGDGEVAVEGLAQDGPAVRIGGTLEPGEDFFEEGELRDG